MNVSHCLSFTSPTQDPALQRAGIADAQLQKLAAQRLMAVIVSVLSSFTFVPQDLALQQAGLSESTLKKLAANRLTNPRDVLATLPLDLMELLDQPMPAIEALLRLVGLLLQFLSAVPSIV